MQSITNAIEQLTKFSERDDVSNIIEMLGALNANIPNDENETSEILRNQLNEIIADSSSEEIVKDGLSLSDAAYNTLSALAKLTPLQDVDEEKNYTSSDSETDEDKEGPKFPFSGLKPQYANTSFFQLPMAEHQRGNNSFPLAHGEYPVPIIGIDTFEVYRGEFANNTVIKYDQESNIIPNIIRDRLLNNLNQVNQEINVSTERQVGAYLDLPRRIMKMMMRNPAFCRFMINHNIHLPDILALSIDEIKNLEEPAVQGLLTSNTITFDQAIALTDEQRQIIRNGNVDQLEEILQSVDPQGIKFVD